MKKQIMIIVLLGCTFGLNTDLTAQSALSDNATKHTQVEKTSSSHSLHLGYCLPMYQDAYKIFTKMPLTHLTLTYKYDIPWRYERTNLFVLTGGGYSGGRREKGLYKASNDMVFERYFYDQFHLYSGIGVNVKLPYSLNLSFSTAIDASIFYEVGSYPSYYNKDEKDIMEGSYVNRAPSAGLGVKCRTALFLTYEIRNILVSAGCQAYFGSPDDLLNSIYFFEDYNASWRENVGFPSCLWATLGVGYRF